MKIFYLIPLLLLGVLSYSQTKNFNKLSLEAAGGFNIPITPTSTIDIADYTIPRHLDIGARYAFTKNWSLKLYYSRDRFQNKMLSEVGVTYHRVSIEAYFNLSQKLRILETSRFNILTHAGVGITYAYPEAIERFLNGGRFTYGIVRNFPKEYERIGNLIVGFTPQYILSERWVLTMDTSMVFNREQQYGYDGELLSQNWVKERGAFLNFSLGVQHLLGNGHDRHADWLEKR